MKKIKVGVLGAYRGNSMISFCSQSSYCPLHTPVFLSRLLFHLKITSIPLYFWDDYLYFSRNNGVKFYELSAYLSNIYPFSRKITLKYCVL